MTIQMRQLIDLYSKEGARSIFETLTAVLLGNINENIKSIRVQKGDGGVDSFEGDFGNEITVYQCKYFTDGIGDSQKQQIRDSFETARNNMSFILKKWVLCLPQNMSHTEQEWFSNWKSQNEYKYNVEIDYLAEDFYIRELLKPENESVMNHYFQLQFDNILKQIQDRLDRLSPEKNSKYNVIFFHELLERIDEDYFLWFIEHVSNHCRFERDDMTRFREFIYWASKPSNGFTNAQVQMSFENFLEQCKKLSHFAAIHFFYRKGEKGSTEFHLYPDLNVDLDGSFNQKKMARYDKHSSALYELCCQVRNTYKVFIRQTKEIIFN